MKLLKIDSTIFWGILNKCWGFISGPITTVIIIFYLTPEFQGYFYTFIQVAAISHLSDMGLNTIFLFIISKKYSLFHKSNASFSDQASSETTDLKSVLSLMYKYLLIVPFIIFPIVYFFGLYFFNAKDSFVIDWQFAWLVLSFVISIDVSSLFLIAHLEAFNKVKLSNQIKLIKSVVTSVSLWTLLMNNYGLLSIGYAVALGLIFFVLIYIYVFRKIILFTLVNRASSTINWREDIWPFQWKMAVTWIFGSYLLYNSNIIIVFYYLGPLKAGMFGLTFAVSELILTASHIWIEVITPKITYLVTEKKYDQARKLLTLRLIQTVVVTLILGIIFYLGLYIIKINYDFVYERFMPLYSIPLILIAGIIRHIIHAQTIFIRSHQKEDMMLSYVCAGVSSIIFTIALVPFLGLLGVCIAILMTRALVHLPTSTYTYYKFLQKNNITANSYIL